MSDRAQQGEIARWVRDGRLRANIGQVATPDDAVEAFNPTARIQGRPSAFVREAAAVKPYRGLTTWLRGGLEFLPSFL